MTRQDNLPSSINGICYVPAPSDDTAPPPEKYFDTDFTNSSFPLLWGTDGGGRGDLDELARIGVNFLRLYDWSVPPELKKEPAAYQRNHLPFLQYWQENVGGALVPISNYFLGQIHEGNKDIKGNILAIVNEFYFAAGSYSLLGIGNEYDLATSFDLGDVVTAMEYVVAAEEKLNISPENRFGVTSPVSFAAANNLPPGIDAIQRLQEAVEASPLLGSDFWSQRFVAALNSFNDGPYLTNYIDKTFPSKFADLPFFFSEMGVPIQEGTSVTNEQEQAAYLLAQLKATKPRGNFLGRCVFQFLNQSALKSGPEASFGITKYSGSETTTGQIQPPGYVPGGGDPYPVDNLTQKPSWESVAAVYRSSSD